MVFMGVIRQRQPDRARRRLLEEAAAVVRDKGVIALTLDAVARRAELSKGGLLHHFPSKKALLESLADAAIVDFEIAVEAAMDERPRAPARFSRAYFKATSDALETDNRRQAVLALLMAADAALRERWSAWLAAQLRRHAATDASPEARVIRLAADGLWLAGLAGGPDAAPDARASVIERLNRFAETG